MPTAASVEAYRTLLVTVGEAALTDLEGLWRGWPWDDARGVRDAAELAVPDVVWAYQDVTGGLAADQYDTWREEARVRGRFTATPAQVSAEDQIIAGVRNAIGPLFGADPDTAAARALLSGMVTRLVTHGSADTMVGSVRRDPAAVGWSRHTRTSGCGFCRMLQGRGSVYRKQEAAVFAAHDHCIPGDVLVQSPTVEVGTRRWYEGPLVVIRTAGGRELAITPNHPVLTRRGWVAAGLLEESDQVVVSAPADRAAALVPYEQQVPTPVEQVWGAARVDRLAAVPVSAEDFHGDRGRRYGNVEVVPSDRLLSYVVDAARGEHRAQELVARAGAPPVLRALTPGRGPGDLLIGEGGPAYSVMRGGRERDALGGGHRAHTEPVGFGPGTHRQPCVPEPSGYGCSGHTEPVGHREHALTGLVHLVQIGRGLNPVVPLRDGTRRFDPASAQGDSEGFPAAAAKLAGDLLERLSGLVELDGVADLGVREHAGHVFNLQTVEGWYSAANVVVSNCRCTVAPSWDPDAPVPVREQYLASQRSPSNADRARVRAYLAEHFPDA